MFNKTIFLLFHQKRVYEISLNSIHKLAHLMMIQLWKWHKVVIKYWNWHEHCYYSALFGRMFPNVYVVPTGLKHTYKVWFNCMQLYNFFGDTKMTYQCKITRKDRQTFVKKLAFLILKTCKSVENRKSIIMKIIIYRLRSKIIIYRFRRTK